MFIDWTPCTLPLHRPRQSAVCGCTAPHEATKVTHGLCGPEGTDLYGTGSDMSKNISLINAINP